MEADSRLQTLEKPERGWVWHASAASRDAGKISVQACVETLLAVFLFWWIAVKLDDYFHLIVSVFVAPLLLLRSPQSVQKGLNWFFTDWFGIKRFASWSLRKRALWLFGGAALVSSAAVCLTVIFSETSFGSAFFYGEGYHIKMGLIGSFVAYLLAVGISGVYILNFIFDERDEKFFDRGEQTILVELWSDIENGYSASLPLIILSALLTEAILMVMFFFDEGKFQFTFFFGLILMWFIGFPSGMAIRALFFRVVATFRFLDLGVKQVPSNWFETNFIIDSTLPAELMPGIHSRVDEFAFDGWLNYKIEIEGKGFLAWIEFLLEGFFLFFPAFFYRLSLKATVWFWWPLAFLLGPHHVPSTASRQKQRLCWPWENPFQKTLILGSVAGLGGAFLFRYYNPAVTDNLNDPAAVALPLKILLGTDWAHLAPWHLAALMMVFAGVGMLWVAGRACSHKSTESWDVYAAGPMRRDLWLMTALSRIRGLATIAFLLFGLGMCLVSFPNWRSALPEPLFHRLERFYRVQEFRELERLKNRYPSPSIPQETLPATSETETPK